MIRKLITFFGQSAVVACDAKCHKAWGIDSRPSNHLDEANPDDWEWLADGELGEAPADPGTYEGGHGKPIAASSPADINKWCVRQCERMEMSPAGRPEELPTPHDFSQRIPNLHARRAS